MFVGSCLGHFPLDLGEKKSFSSGLFLRTFYL
jgi:hypothetical protein